MLLFRSMTVLENLLVAPREYPGKSILRSCLRPTPDPACRSGAGAGHMILARMGLNGTADSMVTDLPFGQQKLIGLARALMNDGPLLLLDEPMAGVEGAAYETMQRVVREEAASGRAVCVVEHNVSFIRDLCSRAVFMAQRQDPAGRHGGRIDRQRGPDRTLFRNLIDACFTNVSAGYGGFAGSARHRFRRWRTASAGGVRP